MKRLISVIALGTLLAGAISCAQVATQSPAPVQPMSVAERKEYLQKIQEILPKAPASYDQWLQQSNALPPDYNSMPKVNTLPDPLLFADGKRVVKNAADWKQRREEIIYLFETYDIGRIPPKPILDAIVPVDAAQLAREAAAGPAGRGGRGARGGRGPATGPAANGPTTGPAVAGGPVATGPAARGGRGGRGAGGLAGGPPGAGRGRGAAPGSTTQTVDLKYGPGSQCTTRVTVTIPPGTGPFPVFISGTPDITNRGYISCVFPNSVDAPPDVGRFYPGYDWGSMAKVAWTAQMVVDYLYTLPQVDKPHIAITGYSRIGKMAAIATMLDERITACVAGSTGVGGILSWRSAGERGAGEGIESTTRSFPIWFAPQLRFFAGREDRLPIDGNLLAAAIAPRSLLNLYGLSDEVSNIYGNEQTYYSAQRIYSLLGVPEHNSILHPPGHHGANDQNATMDWLDIQFGKSTAKWDNKILFPWDYAKWLGANKDVVDLSKYKAQGAEGMLASVNSTADWEEKAANVRKSVEWMLGDKAGGAGGPDPAQRGRDDVVDWAIQRGGSFGWLEPQKSNTEYKSFTFGEGTRAELYYPKGTAPDAHLPTVVWLHGFSYPMGYMWVYHTAPDMHPILALVRAGYAVVAFDQTGHGSRTDEFATFADRFPNWSRMGRMVADTRAAMDAASKDGMVDPERFYLYGYSMGGMLGLHVAALDPRVKGVVSIDGFTPMRTDTADRGTGGLARYSTDLPLLPRLGAFIGNEAKLPYDYNELIAAIAPRPVMIVQGQLDRDATPADVHTAVDQARKVYGLYGASDKLALDEPWDYNRLPEATQDKVIEWMGKTMK